jgi:DNA adenine methylase
VQQSDAGGSAFSSPVHGKTFSAGCVKIKDSLRGIDAAGFQAHTHLDLKTSCAVTKHKTKPHSIKMPRHSRNGFLSPFRYPGGKSWFVKTARRWLESQPSRPKILVEPFAGGAGISLAAVPEKLVDQAVFAEIDRDVAATWKTILNGEAKWLADEITSFRISRKKVEKVLARTPATQRRRAFRCLLWNRTSRGGVITKGAGLIREGENGNGLSSRWYPDTLGRRIKTISALKSKLTFTESNGFNLIRKYIRHKQVVFFVDPPYTKAARRLYSHWEIDHEKIFAVLTRAKGAILMTYDDTSEVRNLAKKYGFRFKRISMRTTHHENKRELMISNNFDWLNKSRSSGK